MFAPNVLILIVDDMKSMRTMIKGQLRQLGYSNFVEADDGRKAINIMNEAVQNGSPVQLILSDWNMPNMTGLEFLGAIRADDEFKNTTFAMITAEGDVDQVKQAIKLGVSIYIVKPFTTETFREKLTELSKKHQK